MVINPQNAEIQAIVIIFVLYAGVPDFARRTVVFLFWALIYRVPFFIFRKIIQINATKLHRPDSTQICSNSICAWTGARSYGV